jgi:hypothetical protein
MSSFILIIRRKENTQSSTSKISRKVIIMYWKWLNSLPLQRGISTNIEANTVNPKKQEDQMTSYFELLDTENPC